ncbi:MAG: hypothetical protein LBH72_05690 [Proteiniphilum sp.]|jgi:hypothetical protein|nr:hypothetical protein [Proteiniphilum sp.]
MKAKTVFLTLLLLAASSMLRAQSLEGTWKAIESSGNPVRENYTHLKYITTTHFIWTMSDKDGNIISGAGGTYTLVDGVYTETILYTLPGMKNWKGKSARYEVKVEGKKMTVTGYLEYNSEKKVENTESWEKIDGVV